MTSVSVPIYQIKITLKHSKPNIWRRIQVLSNTSFLQLHHCIQEAMGWDNCHLFQFKVKPVPLSIAEQIKRTMDLCKISLSSINMNKLLELMQLVSPKNTIITMPLHYVEKEPRGINNEDENDENEIRADQTLINKFFNAEKDKLTYEYDFGDGWEHDIVLEKILQAQPDLAYPRLTAGKCACPPEDCGGIGGYYEMAEAINNPNHPNHNNMVEWIGENEWDVKEFDLPKEGVVLNTWTT